ncbi:hypothetical protein J6590_053686, partial [Homalodisca vitripennis]
MRTEEWNRGNSVLALKIDNCCLGEVNFEGPGGLAGRASQSPRTFRSGIFYILGASEIRGLHVNGDENFPE